MLTFAALQDTLFEITNHKLAISVSNTDIKNIFVKCLLFEVYNMQNIGEINMKEIQRQKNIFQVRY